MQIQYYLYLIVKDVAINNLFRYLILLKCIWLVIFLRNNPICKIGILFNVIAINDAKEFCLGCFILSLIMTLSFTKKESEWVSGIGVLITMQTYPKLGEKGAKLPKTLRTMSSVQPAGEPHPFLGFFY